MQCTALTVHTCNSRAGWQAHIRLAVALAHQLADIDLAALAPHVREARVADVRVVRPDHDLRLGYAQILPAGHSHEADYLS